MGIFLMQKKGEKKNENFTWTFCYFWVGVSSCSNKWYFIYSNHLGRRNNFNMLVCG